MPHGNQPKLWRSLPAVLNFVAVSYLVPGVQEHHIAWVQVILGEVGDLSNQEPASLIGTFEEPDLDVQDFLLQPAVQSCRGQSCIGIMFIVWVPVCVRACEYI